MTAAVATARRAIAAPAPRPPRLGLANGRPAPAVRRARVTLRPLAVSVGLVIASLLAVVVGNMMLASGQLQLQTLEQRLAQVQSAMASSEERYQEMTSPQFVARTAQTHHDVTPLATYTLPYVGDLSRRLPAPRFTSLPCCTITPRR